MTARPKFKVLQVIDTLGMGGAETWLMEVLRLWSKTGMGQLDFLLTSGHRGIFDTEASDLGAKLHYLRFGRSTVQRFTRGFRQILATGDYNAIHDHGDTASGWHLLMGAGVLPPVRVVHVHNPTLHMNVNYAVSPSRKFVVSMGRSLINLLATDICGTSEEILRSYGYRPRQVGRPKVSVLHCGIDVDHFNGEPERDRESVLQEFGWMPEIKLVLFVGRLDRALEYPHPKNHKNSWFALNVMRTAIAMDPSLRFIMAGDADHVSVELDRWIGSWGLRDKLRIAGIRKDVPRLMHAADALLFPSVQEGLGMVAVEAQAAGLPVLASTAVPLEAIVVPELYEALSLDQSLDSWAQHLIRLLAKPRLSRQLCQSVFERSPFSIANSARNLEAVYRGASR
ncbi:MAG: glycosyltransferase [Rhizomicrobium sp.]